MSIAEDNSERFDELLKALDLPESKLTSEKMTEF